jgi:hypothetical protein
MLNWTIKVIAKQLRLLAACFMRVSCLAYSSTLKMEATFFSEASVNFQWTTRCYITEGRTVDKHPCESLKSHTIVPGHSDATTRELSTANVRIENTVLI